MVKRDSMMMAGSIVVLAVAVLIATDKIDISSFFKAPPSVPTGSSPTPTITPVPNQTPNPWEQKCLDTGGILGTDSCCGSAGSYPDTCINTGKCMCGPADSVDTPVCICPHTGQCFDRAFGCRY